MKTMGFCALSVLWSMTAHGGISDALGASGPLPPQIPASPSNAAPPPLLDAPAGGAARDTLPGSPRRPNSMPAPAPTNHYAGSLSDLPVRSGC